MMKHCDYKGYSFWCGDVGMMTPKQYIKMIDLLEETKPKRICELGSGQSTEIFETYQNNYKYVSVFSIEHDKYFRTHKSVVMIPLKENTSFNGYEKCTVYDGFEKWLEEQNKFDFVLIDGPNDTLPKNEHNLIYSRIQMLSFLLLDKLNDNAVIMYHDSNTEEARNTLDEFEKLLEEKNISYEKETILEDDKETLEYNIKILEMCPELVIYKIKMSNP